MRNITEGTDEKLAEWKACVVLSLDLKRKDEVILLRSGGNSKVEEQSPAPRRRREATKREREEEDLRHRDGDVNQIRGKTNSLECVQKYF